MTTTLERRELLKLAGLAAGAAGVGACGQPWLSREQRVALALRGPGLETEARTVCGLCEAGCGLSVRLVDGVPVGVKGDARHPLNRGGLCPVGQTGLDVLYAPERLRGPLRRSGGGFEPTTWETALGEIAGRLEALRAGGQGHRVVLLSGESSALFNELAASFLGALGSSSMARLGDLAGAGAYRWTQGLDQPPGLDLAHADLVISFGLDLFEDGPVPVHAISALVGSRPTEGRCALVHVGSRQSPTAARAEERVVVRPGTYAALALGVAHVLVREGSYDRRFVEEHCFGFEDWTDEEGKPRLGFRRLLLEQYYPDRAAQLCGCEPQMIMRLARRVAAAAAPLAIAGGEALEASNGTWTGLAVHALNALCGVIGRTGGVLQPAAIPFTPMPANAGQPATDQPSLLSAPGLDGAGGLDPVEALVERSRGGDGGAEVLFVVGCDPVRTSPAGERLRDALGSIPVVVALTPVLDETAAQAGWVLPPPIFLETWSESTTPSTVAFSTLGLGRPVIEPLCDSRHPGDVFLELARQLGAEVAASLPWAGYEDYVRQRVGGLAVSGQGVVVSGSFEESWVEFLEERGWRFLEHADEERFWDDLVREGAWWDPVRPLGDWRRLLRTPTGRYEFFSRELERRLRAGGTEVADEACLPHYEPAQWEGEGDLELLPFRPITARGRLGGLSPMLLEMFGYPVLSGWETWAEVAPSTAHALGLGDGDRVAVESDRGSIEAVLRVQPGTVPGSVHVPLGLGLEPAAAEGAVVGSNPTRILLPVHDSLSRELCLAGTRVSLRLVRRRAHGGPAPHLGGETA